MSKVVWKAAGIISTEHQLEELDKKLFKINKKFMVLIVLFVATACFLMLFQKSHFINMLIAGAPFMTIYFFWFRKLLKNYRSLRTEYKKLEEKQAVEQGRKEAALIKMNTQYLYFRRN